MKLTAVIAASLLLFGSSRSVDVSAGFDISFGKENGKVTPSPFSPNATATVHKSLHLPQPSSLLHPNNTIIAATATATTLRTIYTASPNVIVQPLSMRVFNLTAYVDKQTKNAHYEFTWVIEPDFHAVECRAIVQAADGKLDNVDTARCIPASPSLPTTRESASLQVDVPMPPLSSFAWKLSDNTTTMLILRSSNPANAHHCPYFPHDACWAQGLYPISQRDFEWVDGEQRYIGRRFLRFPGTYCKSGMKACLWSEYIY
ncbi:hypothetical protein BD289DRAFT_31550 [Coniella lustricola]|uniref:Ubiquitin 3 binding protein But2 C-terminal domain-containing protein n=1 Tax=Coniella lustricola TaxID=2025994 RepID=A0A2T3A2T2_9PEZI|nr:hypothetical protein BD289DRAFT_31550 [Coniella lustricola]